MQMAQQQDQFVKLIGLSTFLEEQENLDESLDQMVAMAANILHSATCSIMLFKEDDAGEGFRLRIFAKHGDLPQRAYTEAVKVNDGIAGKVAATGQALLVKDISETEFFNLARRPDAKSRSFICTPIVINRKVIGVLNVSNPLDIRSYDYSDLNLSVFVALLVGKSVQVNQLQSLLKSKFAQLALAGEARQMISGAVSTSAIESDKVVKMLAKTFYKEMTKAGFHWDQIVSAATEILGLLNESLDRHNRRNSREGEKQGDCP